MSEYLIHTLETLKKDGKASLNLKEAANLTGGAFGKGGEFKFTDAFFSLRYANPLRLGTMVETTMNSAARWVAKTGDATNYNSSNGPWGEQVQFDVGNADTRFWSLPMRVISTVVPIRRSIFETIPNSYMAIVGDILYELSMQEAFSACQNLDNPPSFTAVNATNSSPITSYGNGFQWTLQIPSTANLYVGQFATVSGATNPTALNGNYRILSVANNASVTIFYPTNPGNYQTGTVFVTPSSTSGFGGAQGLRGLDSYNSANATFSTGTTITQNPQFVWGPSGDAPSATAGRHSIANITQGGSTIAANIVYNDLVNVANALPGQYWSMESTCWHIHPDVIRSLRTLKDSQNLPQYLDIGIPRESGAVAAIQGWPVIPNPYLSYKYPIYLMNPMMALSFVDSDDIELQLIEQYLPGTMAVYVQKRLAFSIKDAAAIVRLQALA